LEIENAVRRRIGYTPELALSRFHAKDGRGIGGVMGGVSRGVCRNMVDREVLEGNAMRVSASSFGYALDRGLVSDHEDAMTQIRHCGFEVFNAVNDQGSGGATQECLFREPVYVGVIPVQPGWLVGRNGKGILERLACINEGLDHFIGMAGRGRIGAMKVHVQ
jgi:hypothetical protein